MRYIWMKGGKIYQQTGYKDGSKVITKYKPNNTYIEYNYYIDGSINSITHYQNGICHNTEGKPSRLLFTSKGWCVSKSWTNYGIYHDYNKPSEIQYFPSGAVKAEYWYINDRLGRLGNKPAKIFYHPDGSIQEQVWLSL